jgi:hypothetical protein
MSRTRRFSKADKALVVNFIGRAFSRSEYKKQLLDKMLVKDYSDPSRKRVTRWFKCRVCKKMVPAFLGQLDHIEPKIPVGVTSDEISLDELMSRAWCDEKNLQLICKAPCHEEKSKLENEERRRIKKENK